MDVSAVGASNSALYLQRAASGLQAPTSAAKQEEQAAQVIAQTAQPQIQPQQQQQQQVAATINEAAKTVGRILDVEA